MCNESLKNRLKDKRIQLGISSVVNIDLMIPEEKLTKDNVRKLRNESIIEERRRCPGE